ncbi:MAG TPA: PilZ domain-containing protein [bacterium]|nr:PilZ domain-containing protein [bacterium]
MASKGNLLLDGVMDLEKRREDRVLLSLPVRFKVFDLQRLEKDVQDPSLGSEAELNNLSSSGLQIASTQPFQRGDVLELELDLPETGRIRSVAKVVWCRKDGAGNGFHCGIQLIPVYPEDLDKLHDFLKKEPG